MTVTPEERDAMARLLNVMEGNVTPLAKSKNNIQNSSVELAGPGQVTSADVNAMAQVLNRLNFVADSVVGEMITESQHDPDTNMLLNTNRNKQGVRVGSYQIMIKEDPDRMAGKQYYSIYNTINQETIADDISLYETAISVVKLLNKGIYVNNSLVRKLFEQDDSYTSRKQDAIRYKRSAKIAEKKGDESKKDVYESRYQVSIDQAMIAKQNIKVLISGGTI
jgi:hypothetical protein